MNRDKSCYAAQGTWTLSIYVMNSKVVVVLTHKFKARQGQTFITYFLIFTKILKTFVKNLSH